MSLETVLIQLVCFSCAFLLLRARTLQRGWAVVAGFILLVVGVMAVLAPAQTAWVSGGLWCVLILVPLLGFGLVNRLVMRERYRQARWLVSWLRWLHPMDGWLEYPALLRGLELGQQGRIDEAICALQRQQGTTNPLANAATVLLYRMDARWQDAVTWVQTYLPEASRLNDVAVGTLYLRSLGEVGDLNGMLHELEALEQRLERIDSFRLLNLIKMYALAFCGQVEQVQTAFQGELSVYGVNVREFWVATAELAAGNVAIARQRLLDLRTNADLPQQRAIDWRLSHSRPLSDHQLTDPSRKILIRLRTETNYDHHFSLSYLPKHYKPYATYGLIACNLILFALQSSFGASDDLTTLRKFGALIPQLVFWGEWWRIISANFLHINAVHLLMNLVGLLWLGRLVEAALGTGRFLVIYAFSGMGAMFIVALVALLTHAPPTVVVGASGAVMGLLGAMGAILLVDWRRHQTRLVARQLRWLLLLIGFQVIFDLINPEISIVGHLAGLSLGFIAGYGLVALRRQPKSMKR